jgi:hypothetical protein
MKYAITFYKDERYVDVWNVNNFDEVLDAMIELKEKGYDEQIDIEKIKEEEE